MSAALWVVAGVLVGGAALLMLLDLDGVRRAVQAVVDTGFATVPVEKRQRVVGLTTTVLVVGAAVGVAQVLLARSLSSRGVRFFLVLLLALAVSDTVLAVGVVDLAIRVALLLGVAIGAMGAVLIYLPAANLWFGATPTLIGPGPGRELHRCSSRRPERRSALPGGARQRTRRSGRGAGGEARQVDGPRVPAAELGAEPKPSASRRRPARPPAPPAGARARRTPSRPS